MCLSYLRLLVFPSNKDRTPTSQTFSFPQRLFTLTIKSIRLQYVTCNTTCRFSKINTNGSSVLSSVTFLVSKAEIEENSWVYKFILEKPELQLHFSLRNWKQVKVRYTYNLGRQKMAKKLLKIADVIEFNASFFLTSYFFANSECRHVNRDIVDTNTYYEISLSNFDNGFLPLINFKILRNENILIFLLITHRFFFKRYRIFILSGLLRHIFWMSWSMGHKQCLGHKRNFTSWPTEFFEGAIKH